MPFLLRSFLFILIFSVSGRAETFKTIFGVLEVTDPLVLELVHHPRFQRLKKIDASGPSHHFGKLPAYDKFYHSLGVYHLVRLVGGSQEEQVAALLHDVSHTVFCHTGDYVYQKNPHGEKAYQDEKHMMVLEDAGLLKIIKKHNLSPSIADTDNPAYEILEQSYPDVCADRIEYILTSGKRFYKMPSQDIKFIVDNLAHVEGRWFFKKIKAAENFSMLLLRLTEEIFGHPINLAQNRLLAKALLRALEIDLISEDEMFKSNDLVVKAKLVSSKDPEIQQVIRALKQASDVVVTRAAHRKEWGPTVERPKFRAVDPWVLDHKTGELVRLTSVSSKYSTAYERLKEKLSAGFIVDIQTAFQG